MSQIVISADTATIVLNGRIITDIAAGDYVTLTPSNALTSRANSAQNGVSTGCDRANRRITEKRTGSAG